MIYTDDIAKKALKDGDENAYIWICQKYHHQLRLYAAKIVRCMATSEDIVQDVFMKLWNERETIHIYESLQAYLIICIRNKCRDHLDHCMVKRKYTQNITDNYTDQTNNPMSLLVKKDTESIINDVINTLPEQCRKIYLMW